MINNRGVGKKMHQEELKKERDGVLQEELGFILWKVQTIDDFLPCYKTIMRKE